MEGITRDLIIGTIGSVVGAFFVYLGSSGLYLTRNMLAKARAKRSEEESQWKEGSPNVKQTITNKYLFEIFKYMLFGNLLVVFPSLLKDSLRYIAYATDSSLEGVNLIYIVMNDTLYALALIVFYLGIGNIKRYRYLLSIQV